MLTRNVPVRTLALKDGDTLVTTVFDLLCANYGLDRGLGGDGVASDYDQDKPFTPAWAETRHRRAARTTSSMSRANSPPTPRRPTAAPW